MEIKLATKYTHTQTLGRYGYHDEKAMSESVRRLTKGGKKDEQREREVASVCG